MLPALGGTPQQALPQFSGNLCGVCASPRVLLLLQVLAAPGPKNDPSTRGLRGLPSLLLRGAAERAAAVAEPGPGGGAAPRSVVRVSSPAVSAVSLGSDPQIQG